MRPRTRKGPPIIFLIHALIFYLLISLSFIYLFIVVFLYIYIFLYFVKTSAVMVDRVSGVNNADSRMFTPSASHVSFCHEINDTLQIKQSRLQQMVKDTMIGNLPSEGS